MHSKNFILVSVLLLTSILLIEARRDLAVRNTRRVRSPRVMDDCGCLKVAGNSLCLTMTPPMLKLGWQTDQVYSTQGTHKYWQVRFKPYIETAATI